MSYILIEWLKKKINKNLINVGTKDEFKHFTTDLKVFFWTKGKFVTDK